MPRLSISEMTTFHWPFPEDVVEYRAAGIEGIGVWRRKLTEFGEERGAELLREGALAVTSLSYVGGFTGSDGHSYAEALDDARQALQVAAEIQAGCLVVVTGARWRHTRGHARNLVRDALRSIGDAAGEHNLHIAVQPMHRAHASDMTFVNSLDALLDLLHRCDHSQVGMVFDAYHLSQELALCERIGEIVPWVKLVTLSDARELPHSDCQRCLPGEGRLPLKEIVGALETAGYQGFYEMQILSDEHWNSDYYRLLDQCKRAFQALCAPAPSPATSEKPGT